MAQHTEIPSSWKTVKISDIAENIQYGYTESSTKEPIGPKFLRITDIQDNNVEWNQVPYCKIGDEIKKKYLLKSGDLVFARTGATVGKSFLLKDPIPDAVYASYLIRLRFKSNLVVKYIYYYFQSPYYWKQITEGQVGIGQPNVNGTKLGQLTFPLPSLPEQQAIVSKIEELFSELDKGVEELKAAQQQLNVYRQAVLKWAFEGKLTNEDVKEGELPEGWKQVQVKEVAETFGGYAFKSNIFKSFGKYQVIRMGNVRPGELRYDESPIFLDEIEQTVINRSLLQIDDVIITQTGTRRKRDYGFTTIITKKNLLLNQRIAAIRFKELYAHKFFLYYSWTDYFKDQFFANETGNVGQGNVGMKAITETLIPLCSIVEQHKIVLEIEIRFSICDRIEETITHALKQSETLRQSILKQSFEGKLTTNNISD